MKQRKEFILIRTLCVSMLLFAISIYSFSHEDFRKEKAYTILTDGTRLASDVYIPIEGQTHPTILIRTPYGKHQHEYEGNYWSSNGYVVVIQDARGKWDSNGEYIPFLNEKSDGLQTIDWIVKQEWSNGEVALWGSSYLSYCAIAAATANHEAVKTMFIISGWLQGDKIINPGGTTHLQLNLAWLLHEETQRVRSLQKYDLEELFEYLPIIDVFNSIGIESKIWKKDINIRQLNEGLSATQIDIPVFHMSGWNDFVCNAALRIYDETSKNGSNENRLLIGPWFHDQFQTEYTEVGDDDFGPESIMGRNKMCYLALQWFDYILKNKADDFSNEPDVSVFMMGENKWRDFESWPPENVDYQKWYFSSEEGANTLHGDGTLTDGKAGKKGIDSFVFDPMDPVPTYGGANFHFFLHTIGIKDQSEIEEREDVLVYTSDILSEDLEIAGPLKVVLNASTKGKDTDFTAKLVEVRKDGYARIIQEGIIRASYRNSQTERQLLKPGSIYELEIDMGATAIRVPAGSRLRVEISSSNFPKYDRNPNTGEDAFRAEKLVAVKQNIYHGKKHPSYLLLPVLK